LLLLVLLPIGYHGLRGEADRWRAARAMEAWLDGEKQQSIDALRDITQRLPHEHRLKLVLGEWLLEDRQAEQAHTLAREIPEKYRDRRTQALIQHCLMALGQREEALQAYREANPADQPRSPEQDVFHKNALSYYQALASTELDLALQNSNFVVREIAGVWNRSQHIPLSAHLQGLFCTAMIYRAQMQRFEADPGRQAEYANQAITVLSGAIAHLEEEYERIRREEKLALPALFHWWLPDLADSAADSPSSISNLKEDTAHALAALLTLRALVYQTLQQDEASFADRRHVLRLGFEPEQLAGLLPPFADCVFQLELLSMVLDTRGCVLYESNQLGPALADLNIAVMGQQALVDVADFRPRTFQEMSQDPRQQFEEFVRGSRRTLATLLFHRSWARRAVNDNQGAQEDLAAIRELGYVPGNYLF
jgi:tetratricopeptide (TPR) repeat protein